MNKLYVALSVGLPLLSRLLVLFLLSLSVFTTSAKNYTVDSSVVLALTMLTTIGISSLCVVRFSKSPKQNNILEFVILISFVSFIFIPVFYLLQGFEFISDYKSVSLYFYVYSLYLLYRHYYQAFSKYKLIAFVELMILIMSVSLVIYFWSGIPLDMLFYLTIPYLIFVIFCFFYNIQEIKNIKSIKKLFKLFFEKDSIHYILNVNLSNFISSGLSYLVAPLLSNFVHERTVTNVALMQMVTSALAFLPRNFSYYYLPLMSSIADKKVLKSILRKFVRYNILTLTLTSLVLLFASLIDSISFEVILYGGQEHVVSFIFICANLYFSQLSLPYANLFMSKEKSRALVVSNMIYASVLISSVLICYSIFYLLDDYVLVALLYFLMATSQIIKFLYIRRSSHGFFQ